MNERYKHLAFYIILGFFFIIGYVAVLLVFPKNIFGGIVAGLLAYVALRAFCFVWRCLGSASVIGGPTAAKVNAAVIFMASLNERFHNAVKAWRKQPDDATPPNAG